MIAGENYILGGSNGDIKSFPYQALLLADFYGETFAFCGGSIISEKYILSAGHCVDFIDYYGLELTVGVGSHKQSQVQKYKAKKYFIHEDYDYYFTDIAIIELKNSLQFSDVIKPIQLPNANEVIPDSMMMTVSGWGLTESSYGMVENLQYLQLPIINHAKCKSIYQPFYLDVAEWEICAGYLGVEDKNVCNGDSGGPLAANNTVYGIVSWGIGCGLADYPAVYGNVVYFRNWIKQKTGL